MKSKIKRNKHKMLAVGYHCLRSLVVRQIIVEKKYCNTKHGDEAMSGIFIEIHHVFNRIKNIRKSVLKLK